jgi:Zn-dependent protease
MGAILGVPVIAWAKPVPVNPNRLHNPRRDMLVVSLAGPATNFILMVVAAFAARAAFDPSTVSPFGFGIADLPLGVQILFSFALVNLFLGLFNLLPIPPLDGSAIIERALPGAWLPHWYKFRPYGFLVLFLLVFSTGVISEFLRPFENRLIDFVFLSGR